MRVAICLHEAETETSISLRTCFTRTLLHTGFLPSRMLPIVMDVGTNNGEFWLLRLDFDFDKPSLNTRLTGFSPSRLLPIVMDVGTDNDVS